MTPPMTKSTHPELARAEVLLNECRFREALDIVLQIEGQSNLSPEDHLYCMWLKLEIRGMQFAAEDFFQLSDMVYKESCVQENYLFQAQALGWKSLGLSFYGRGMEIPQIGDLLNDLYKKHHHEFPAEEKFLLEMWSEMVQCLILLLKWDLDPVIEMGLKRIRQLEQNVRHKRYLGFCINFIANKYFWKGELKRGLELVQKGFALGYQVPGLFFQQGALYEMQGDPRALVSFQQLVKNATEDKSQFQLMIGLTGLSRMYYRKAEYAHALQYAQQALQINEERSGINRCSILISLVRISLELGNKEQAHRYSTALKQLEGETPFVSQFANALILKKSTGYRSRMQAENILRQLLEEGMNTKVSFELCDLLLDELRQTGDEKIVEEIKPLIQPLIKFAKNQNAFSTLAEAHLLQGRQALIQLNFEEAQQFLPQAQQIAEEHDLQRLAQQISADHDTLLHELDIWENLKQSQAPLQKRLEMASTDSILRRLQGKQAVDPPEMEEELPLLLIIMSSGGIPIFINAFSDHWDVQEEMFSGFLSAINSWGGELFAQSIDRMIFGENIILMNALEPFTVCSVIQGQSYPAQQKLTRFVTGIRSHPLIWEALQQSKRTSMVLNATNTPALGKLVAEIFQK